MPETTAFDFQSDFLFFFLSNNGKKFQLFGAVFTFAAPGDAHEQRIYLLCIDFPRLPPIDLTWIMWLCL